jgi:hypothetical protein
VSFLSLPPHHLARVGWPPKMSNPKIAQILTVTAIAKKELQPSKRTRPILPATIETLLLFKHVLSQVFQHLLNNNLTRKGIEDLPLYINNFRKNPVKNDLKRVPSYQEQILCRQRHCPRSISKKSSTKLAVNADDRTKLAVDQLKLMKARKQNRPVLFL